MLTSGLVALAVGLALFQAAVLSQTPPPQPVTAGTTGQSNRYSAPGGRSGIPWAPGTPPAKTAPGEREGRTPDSKPQREERRVPVRGPSFRPQMGPRPPRRALA